METRTARNIGKRFERAGEFFSGIGAEAVAALAGCGADIALVISPEGEVLDVAYNDLSLAVYGLSHWVGLRWRDTVTPECHDKIADLLAECAATGESRWRQVNHAAKSQADLPVNYKLFAVPGVKWRIAYGRELRQAAQMQQELVQSQMELDREYRRIRETETRYRSAFQKLDSGMFIVTGSDQRIVDLNAVAAELAGESVTSLTGRSVKTIASREDRSKVAATLNEACNEGVAKAVNIRSAAGIELTLRIDPFREHGAINCVVHAERVSGQGGTVAEPEPAEECYSALPEALAIVDERGIVCEVNSDFLDLIRSLNPRNVVGRNISNWIGQSNVESQMLIARAHDDRQVKNFATIVQDEMGNEIPVRISAAAVKRNHKDAVALMVLERRPNENQLTVNSAGKTSASSDFSELVGTVPLKELIREAADVIEKLCIEAALKHTRNNRASAAEMLGLSRQSLYIKLRRHGLEAYDGQD